MRACVNLKIAFPLVFMKSLFSLLKMQIIPNRVILNPLKMNKCLRIDNGGGSVNSCALFNILGMRWYQRKYHVLYTIRQPVMNPIH